MKTTQIYNENKFCNLKSEIFVCEYYDNIGVNDYFLILKGYKQKSLVLPIQPYGLHPFPPRLVYNDDILMLSTFENQNLCNKIKCDLISLNEIKCVINLNGKEYQFNLMEPNTIKIGDKVRVNASKEKIDGEGTVIKIYNSHKDHQKNNFLTKYDILLCDEKVINVFAFCCRNV